MPFKKLKINGYLIYVILLLVINLSVCESNVVSSNNGFVDDSIQDNSMEYTKPYEEYFIEHNISQAEAAKNFRMLTDYLLKQNPPAWCTGNPCTPAIIQYCLGNKMLQDHCCCDSRHGKEQLPWLPHSCYIGAKCRPHIGSCMAYTEYRECCCNRALAKQWTDVLSSSYKLQSSCFYMIIGVVLLNMLHYLAEYT